MVFLDGQRLFCYFSRILKFMNTGQSIKLMSGISNNNSVYGNGKKILIQRLIYSRMNILLSM